MAGEAKVLTRQEEVDWRAEVDDVLENWKEHPPGTRSRAAEHAKVFATLDAERARADEAEARVKVLEAKLKRHCPGTVDVPCSFCGDSTFDHDCNNKTIPCSICAEGEAK